MAPRTWLITGSTTGFGAEFVKNIIKRGDKVIATARNESKISFLKDIGAATLQLDVTASQSELNTKATEAIGIYGGVDVVVNNAGYCAFGTTEDMSAEDYLQQSATNLFGAVNTARAFLPHLRQKRSGVLIFMGSAAGWNGIPTLGAYCTSKFGLRGAVESLQQEVAPFNVKTLLVEPGYFRTEFLNKDNAKYTNTTLEDYRPLCEAVFSSSRATEGNQTGDPAEGVNRVIDIVKGEGYAAGKEFPPWVLLGPDVLAVARKKMEDNLKLLDEWAELSSSTDL